MLGIKFKLFLVVFVTVVMVVSTLGLIYSNGSPAGSSQAATPAGTTASPSGTPSNTVSGKTNPGLSSIVNNALKDKNLTKDLFIPNVNYLPGMQNNHVEPLYDQSPAPMGIGDFGLVSSPNGHIRATYMTTSSFEGTWTVNNLTAFNLGNDGPYSVTVQMNTILAHTTILGKSNFVYWTQNVMVYSTRTHELSFEDNIWNFSSPTAYMTPNTIYNSTGQVIPYPGVHIAIGPTVTLQYPFTVNLFLNTTVLDGMDTVYFNYSIPSLMMNGTYDRVMFNSTYGMPPGYSAPPAYFEVNGNKLNPEGLLYDAELMIGGPGGGSTNSIYTMNSTMSLKYLSTQTQMPSPPSPPSPPGPHGPGMSPQTAQSSDMLPGPGPGKGGSGTPPSHPGMHQPHGPVTKPQYLNVPSAYDFGTDTGETSEGVAVAWNFQDQAILTAGPSLLYGMWNVSTVTTMEHYTGQVSPSNAFMFVDSGTYVNPENAGWSPLSTSGSYSFWLPAGMYTAEYLMSDYNPVTEPLFGSFNNNMGSFGHANTVRLRRDVYAGIYTPLFASNNAQLANISTSGTGTAANPYIAENVQNRNINPLFSQINDFLFPVFEGVMIMDTSAHFDMNRMPNFMFSMPQYADAFLSFYNITQTNYMGYWLYNTSNISLWNTSLITGYFSPFGAGFPFANIILWNSSNDLIGSNVFQTMDSSMLIFGGSNNTVWGNTFTNVSPVLMNQSGIANVSLYGEPLALSVYSSGNLIYNNNFTTSIPAYSPDYSIYTGNSAYYINAWNVSLRPASTYSLVNGYNLTGTIVPSSYQGGNYWYNFNGIIPYNDSGLIVNGGDYEPLNILMVPYGPLIQAPMDAIVVVPVYAAYVSHNTTSTITNDSVFFPYGSYSSIEVTFFDQFISNPFDDSFIVQVGNTQILAGNTLEDENTSVTQPVTQYYNLLQGQTSVTSLSPQFNPGYASRLSTWFTFYRGSEATHPQKVIAAFTDVSFPTPSNAFPDNVPIPFNVTRTTNVTFPANITSAYVNFYEQQNGNDEFWYTLEPPFREFRIYIGNELVATVDPYPNIQTGGGDLFLWQPILGIGAEVYPPYVINLSPYLSLLHGKQEIKVEVVNDENLWIRSALNFMINTTTQPVISHLINTSFNYNYTNTQSPETNLTSESIPASALYLNDTNNASSVLTSIGTSTGKNYYSTYYSKSTDVFFGNSTEYDPNENVLENTSSGYVIPILESFYVNETIIDYSSSTFYYYNNSALPYGSMTITNVEKEYIQINGTSSEYLYLNSSFGLTAIGVGFNVTQIRDISDYTKVSYDFNGTAGGYNTLSYNNTTVIGNGFFLGTIANNTITSLSYNHAHTSKRLVSLSELNGKVNDYYNLYEVAVNNSLVNRNGILIIYEVTSRT